MVFVCSMGDLWHEQVPQHWIDGIIRILRRYPQHTFIFLTKRPKRMRLWKFPDNAWIGVTAENQKRANERIPILLEIPAAVRFVSVEPMLEPVNMQHSWIRQPDNSIDYHQRIGYKNPKPARGLPLDWVICGGETGSGAREMKVEWARDLRDQCKSAGVPFFFKNMSKKAPTPKGLMIREYPK
jgi:protein gp37